LIDPSLPVKPETDFDPLPERWKKQDKLEAFKQRIQKDQMPALFKETTLQAKVLKALNDWREAREKPEPEGPEASRAKTLVSQAGDFDEEIRAYLLKAESLHASLPVAGFATRLKVPIDIEDIYVPLRAMLDLRGVDEECFFADSADAERVDNREASKCVSKSSSTREKRVVPAAWWRDHHALLQGVSLFFEKASSN
jgi:hypothetical protein